MNCYDYFKIKVEENLRLEDFDKYETVSKDGWLRTYHDGNYFNPNEIDKELIKISEELNVDLLWSTSTWGLFIRKRT